MTNLGVAPHEFVYLENLPVGQVEMLYCRAFSAGQKAGRLPFNLPMAIARDKRLSPFHPLFVLVEKTAGAKRADGALGPLDSAVPIRKSV